MLCGATQMGRSWWRGLTECGPLEKGLENHFSMSCLENPMNSMERQNDRTLKKELPRSVGAQYATGDQWRNSSRKIEGMEPKQKQYPLVKVTGDRSKVWCCKEQYCIGTWNVRSMNQGKLERVKQEMARGSIDILGITELEWTGMGEFNSDDHYIYDCGQESLRRIGIAIIVNKSPQCSAISKMTEWSLFISKANFSISQKSKSMSQPGMLKKLKLNESRKTYKNFSN